MNDTDGCGLIIMIIAIALIGGAAWQWADSVPSTPTPSTAQLQSLHEQTAKIEAERKLKESQPPAEEEISIQEVVINGKRYRAVSE